MSKICNSCGAENVDEAKFCRICGNELIVKKYTNTINQTEIYHDDKYNTNEDSLKNKNNIPITEDIISTDFILEISIRVILVIVFGYLIHIG